MHEDDRKVPEQPECEDKDRRGRATLKFENLPPGSLIDAASDKVHQFVGEVGSGIKRVGSGVIELFEGGIGIVDELTASFQRKAFERISEIIQPR